MDVTLVAPSKILSHDNSTHVDVKYKEALVPAYIAGMLRANSIKTEIKDCALFNIQPDELVNDIIKSNPQLIIFSVPESGFDYSKISADLLRKANFEGHITFCGSFPTICTKTVLQHCRSINSVIRGEVEEASLILAQKIIKGESWKDAPSISYIEGSEFINNDMLGLSDLDSRPFPARDHLQEVIDKGSMATVVAGRGCMAKCTYCSIRAVYNKIIGPKWRSRTASNIAQEIENLVKDYKIERLNIYNLLGTTPEAMTNTYRLGDELKRRNVDVKFHLNCRPNQVDREMFEFLKDHGLEKVEIGIETMATNVLQSFHRGTTPEEAYKALEIIDNLDLQLKINMILFHPKVTCNELRANLEFMKQRFEKNPSRFFHELGSNLAKKLPVRQGTSLANMLKIEGTLKQKGLHLTYTIPDNSARAVFRSIKYIEPIYDYIFTSIRAIQKNAPRSDFWFETLARIFLNFLEQMINVAQKEKLQQYDLNEPVKNFHRQAKNLLDAIKSYESVLKQLPNYTELELPSINKMLRMVFFAMKYQ